MSTFITADRRHIVTPYRSDLAELVPHAHPVEYQGASLLVLPNEAAEAKLARNIGVPMPAPILTRYDWAGLQPWAIQRTTAALLTENLRAYVLNAMGTGKSRSVLWAFDWLRQSGRARRMLISAPLSTLTPVWEDELFRHFPHLSRRVLHGDRARRLKRLAEDADVYIVNHHGVPLLREQLAARRFDVIVLDELAVLRNKQTALWRAHNALIEPVPFAWGLTGAPTPMAPTDAWAQVRLLTPGRVPRSLRAFREATMVAVSQFKFVPRRDANAIVHQAMQPAVRFSRDDVMELPPTSFVDREAVLSPQGAQAYKLLCDKMALLTQQGQSVTAVNEGVLHSKLLQVACGYVYTDADSSGAKQVFSLPSQSRLDALEETILETDRKVIVFVPFLHALEGVAAYLRKQGHDVAVIHGATSRPQRDTIFRGFQYGGSPRVLVAHPQTMAHGLTLTAANTIVWYGPTQSLEIYDQANARIVRPSQTAKTFIVHLLGTKVERMTYARLKTRSNMQGLLLDLFQKQEVLL